MVRGGVCKEKVCRDAPDLSKTAKVLRVCGVYARKIVIRPCEIKKGGSSYVRNFT